MDVLLLLPNVAWFTDVDDPADERIMFGRSRGLLLSCNRVEFRVTVEHIDDIVPWRLWVRSRPKWSNIARSLAAAPGVDPQRWWISEIPVPVLRVERFKDKNKQPPKG